MAKAEKNAGVDPCHLKIQEYIKEGRCSLQKMSIRQIVRDRRLQARELEIDLNHSRTLGEILASLGDGAELAPIAVFCIDEKHHVVDGFHRLTAYEKAGRAAIRAFVITGTWSEAVQFAAMANQMNTAKPRSRDDIKKSISMVLDLGECESWSAHVLANHVGCSPTTAIKHATAFFEKSGRAAPDMIVKSNGHFAPRINSAAGDRVNRYFSNAHGGPLFKTNLHGRRIAARGRENFEEKIAAARKSMERISATVAQSASLSSFLAYKGIGVSVVDPGGLARNLLPGIMVARGFLVGRVDFRGGGSIYESVGRLLSAREFSGSGRRMVIACDPQAGPASLMAILEKHLGIEFMTPDELVERIKSEKGASNGEAVAC